MTKYNHAPAPHGPSKLAQNIMVGVFTVGMFFGIARGVASALEVSHQNAPGITTAQLDHHHYDDVNILDKPDGVEIAEGINGDGTVDYWVGYTQPGQDLGSVRWTEVPNAGHGALLDVQVASDDEYGYGDVGVAAITTIDDQGNLTVGVDTVNADTGSVVAVGQETVNDPTTQEIAGNIGVVGPSIEGQQFGYGQYNVDGGVSTRADTFTENISTKTGSVEMNVQLQGAPIIPGTQI